MHQVNELQAEKVAAAFGSVAPDFEETLENEITRAHRRRIYETVRSLAPKGSRILDLNCGIGIDAIAMAQEGYKVSGVDISPGMIKQAKARAAKTGARDVEFLVSSFDNLSMFAEGTFNLILSNFGGLNCSPSLEQCAAESARVIHPGGHFVAVVMPKVSLWEVAAGFARLDLQSAFRRLGPSVEATGFRGNTFRVFYYSPGAFRRVFARWFKLRHLEGMNVVSPPPHAIRFRTRHPLLSAFLEKLESVVSPIPLIRSAGDHSMIVLQRNPPDKRFHE